MAGPTLAEFTEKARALNPDYSDDDIKQYWAQNYAQPADLPSFQSFLPQAKKLNPSFSDTDIRLYWEDNYGKLGAPEKDPPPTSLARRAADIPIGLAKGVVDLPKAALGLADVATGGKAGDVADSIINTMGEAADAVGLPAWARPSQWSAQLRSLYSKETQQAMSAVGESAKAEEQRSKDEGGSTLEQIGASAKGALTGIAKNPSAAIPLLAENYGGMKVIAMGTAKAIAPLAKQLDGAVKAGTMSAAEADAVLGKAAIKYAAAGEGILTAGQVSTAIDEADPSADFAHRLMAAVAGGVTGAITRGTSSIPGLGDAEATMATSSLGRATGISGSLPARIGKGIISEGLLQELPQSAQEQAAQNIGASKPWQEGVGEQAITGLVAGSGMGGAMAAVNGTSATPSTSTVPQEQQGPGQPQGPEQPQPQGPQLPQPLGPQHPEPLGPNIPEPMGPQQPQPLGPSQPELAGPALPVSLGPTIPQPVGPSLPEAMGPDLLRAIGPANEPAGPYRPTVKDILAAPSVDDAIKTAFELTSSATTLPRVGRDIPDINQGFTPLKESRPIEVVPPVVPKIQEISPREAIAQERSRLLAMRHNAGNNITAQTPIPEIPTPSAPLSPIAQERARLLAMKNGGSDVAPTPSIPRPVEPAPERAAVEAPTQGAPQVEAAPIPKPVEAQGPTVEDLHALAEGKGFNVDSPSFKELTKLITQKSHLDDLTPDQRIKVAERLQKLPSQPSRTVPELERQSPSPVTRGTTTTASPAGTAQKPTLQSASYSDLVRMQESAAAAKRRLSDIPPSLKSDAIGFAESGMKPTAKNVEKWLASKGTIGAVDSLVKNILKHQKDANAVRLQSEYSKELGARERISDPDTDAATVPRSTLPVHQNMDMLLRAEKAQADLEIAGKERGGRFFIEQQGQGSTQDVRGLKSATSEWYRELTKGTAPLKREQIERAIQKIIKDEGTDVGKAVERVKEVLLRDREFNQTPWGEDADAIMRGEWPSWIPKPGEKAAPTETKQAEPEPFALKSETVKPKKETTPKPEQTSIDVPPPTVGEKPIIARETTPEESPLFSKAAQQPAPEQATIPENPGGQIPVPMPPGGLLNVKVARPAEQANPQDIISNAIASALRTAAEQIEKTQEPPPRTQFSRSEFASPDPAIWRPYLRKVVRQSPLIPGTHSRLMDTSAEFPPELLADMAEEPYVERLTATLESAFQTLREAMPEHLRDVSLLGLSPDSDWKGIHLTGTVLLAGGPEKNVIILNPFMILRDARTELTVRQLNRDLETQVLAEQLVDTTLHELVHQELQHDPTDPTDRRFQERLQEYRNLLHSVTTPLVQRVIAVLQEETNGRRNIDHLGESLARLGPYYPDPTNPAYRPSQHGPQQSLRQSEGDSVRSREGAGGRVRSEGPVREGADGEDPQGRGQGSSSHIQRSRPLPADTSRSRTVSPERGNVTPAVTFDDLNSPTFPGLAPIEPPNLPSRAKFIGDLTGPQEAALARVHGTKETWTDKLNSFKSTWKRELVQGLFDQFAPILDYSKKGYMLARMAKGGDGTLEALLMYGKPYVDKDGAYKVAYNEQNGLQGFSKVLSSLQGEHDRFLEWVAAHRADRLKSIGLEHLYRPEDIAALKTLNHGNLPDGSRREPAYLKALKELNDWNDAMTKIAVDSGLITDETRETFKNVPYIPFYRLHEEGVTPGFGMTPGLVNQKAWKKLKGGTEHLNDDLLANLLQNWSHLITASAKNRAAKETLRAAELAGVAEQVPSGAPGKDLVRYSEGGKEVAFAVSDPALLDAVSALHYAGLGAIGKPFQTMKRYLSFAVTVNPAYKLRNLARDTIQAIATSDLSYNPIKNISQGAKATGLTSEVRAQLLAGGGMIRFGSMLDGTNADRTRRLIEQGVDKKHILSDDNAVQKFWKQAIQPAFEAYQELGDRGEQINRAALYQQMLAKGMTHQEAAFWARDLMDFSMAGKWAAVRILTQVVPFMGARLVGIAKLGRAAQSDYKKFSTTIGAVALASIALLLAYKDDDDWKRRDEWDKNNYWYFKIGDTAIRIPKPFEIGVIGTIAERGVQYMIDDEMTGANFGKQLSAMIFNQLSMNPTPQLIKPLMDLYANKDAFTGRPIETPGMEKVRKQDRYTEKTSEVGRFLGSLGLPDPAQLAMGRWDTLSPVQVDSLVRGYFSWLGLSATTVLDYGIRPMVDRGERPNMALKDVFLLGNFVESLPTGSSRYVTELYDQASEIEQAFQSFNAAKKRGDFEGAKEIYESEKDKIQKYKLVEHIKRQESKLNERIKVVESSRTLTGEEKRTLIDSLREQRHRLAKQLSDRRVAQTS